MSISLEENHSKEVIILPQTKQEVSQHYVSEMAKLFGILYKVQMRENILRGIKRKKENLCPPTK